MRLVAILVGLLAVSHLVAADLRTCLVPYSHIEFKSYVGNQEIPLLPRYGRDQKALGSGSHAGVSLGTLPADFATFLHPPAGVDWQPGTPVALKIPYKSLSGDRQRIIRHEADMMARVATQDPDHLFARGALDAEGGVLVQEYRAGYVKLADLPQPIGDDRRREISRQLDSALTVLSRAKVVHGDLKIDNILVDTATNKILIIDFSVAAPVGEYPAWTGGRRRETGNPHFHSQGARGDKPAAKDDDWYTVGRVQRWMERPF